MTNREIIQSENLLKEPVRLIDESVLLYIPRAVTSSRAPGLLTEGTAAVLRALKRGEYVRYFHTLGRPVVSPQKGGPTKHA